MLLQLIPISFAQLFEKLCFHSQVEKNGKLPTPVMVVNILLFILLLTLLYKIFGAYTNCRFSPFSINLGS